MRVNNFREAKPDDGLGNAMELNQSVESSGMPSGPGQKVSSLNAAKGSQ
jgi:hypothetical protein